jgi:hypothetical protein
VYPECKGIYDTGFKRGFMGYIGLLLNAPYKIDSMVWMRMRMMFVMYNVLYSSYGVVANGTR